MIKNILKLLTISTLCWQPPLSGEERLGIYLPTAHSPKELQRVFTSDPALKDFKVYAFGSFEDFQTAISNEDLSFALVPSPYLRYYDDFEVLYQLTLDGKVSFQYQLVSLDKAWNESRLDQGIIGSINSIGRDKTKIFVEDLLSGRKFKRVKQVSKVVDLFPLLALGNAQYALFAPHDLEQIKTEFSAKPFQVLKTGDVPYPIIAARKGKKHGSTDPFSKMSPATLQILGLNGIKSVNK